MNSNNRVRQGLFQGDFFSNRNPAPARARKRNAGVMKTGAPGAGALTGDVVPAESPLSPGLAESGSDQALRISVFHSFDQVRSLWKSFEKDAACYAFQRYDWLKNWHEFIGAGPDLVACITVVERPDGAPVMLLPLGIERRGAIRCLVWLGDKITDYQAPLVARDFSTLLDSGRFTALWKEIRARLPPHDAVVLERQPEYIESHRNPFFYLPHSLNVSNAHFTCLGADFEEFLRTKRSAHWLNLERKKERRMAKRGTLVFHKASDPQDAQHILQEMMRQKSQSYRALGVADMFADPRHRRFFGHMSAHHLEEGFVHLSALMLNNKVLATHWGLIDKGRFYCYLPTYAHDEFARFSPGNNLLRRLMEWSIAQGLEVFDFTIGDEAYKYGWCEKELQIFDCLRGTTLGGWLYIAPLRLARAVKRWILRSPLRRPAQLLRAQLGRWKMKYRQ